MNSLDRKFLILVGIISGLLLGSLVLIWNFLSLSEDLQRVIEIVLLNVTVLLILDFLVPFFLEIMLVKKGKWEKMVDWWIHHQVSRWAMLANWLIFAVPLVIIAINYAIIFSWYESLFPLIFLLMFSGLFLPVIFNRHLLKRRFELCVCVVSILIFMFLAYLYWVWLFAGFLNGLNALVIFHRGSIERIPLIQQTSPGYPEKTAFSRRALEVTIIAGMILSPGLAFTFERVGFGSVTLPSGQEPPVLFVDWTWEYEGESPRLMTPEILDAIQSCNNLPRVDVSITINLPMDYITGSKNQTMIDQVQALLDRGIRVNIMPFNPKHPRHYYVNDFTIDIFNQTYQDFKVWMNNSGFNGKITMLIVDLEPLINNISAILENAPKRAQHLQATRNLTTLVELMKSEMHPLGTNVIGAAFGYTAVDLIDLDESVFSVFGVPTYPPTNWDAIGFMNYFFQTGSEYAVYSTCKMLSHYFGTYAIPYITTQELTVAQILNEFKIIRNLGINITGIWALHQFLNRYSLADFIAIHQGLDQPSDVTFKIEGAFIPTIYTSISLLDLMIYDPLIYPLGRQKDQISPLFI